MAEKCFPSFYVSGYFEYRNELYFMIAPRGIEPWKAMADLHCVDRNTGRIGGAIPIMMFMMEEDALEAMQSVQSVSLVGRLIRKIYRVYLQYWAFRKW